MLCRRLASLNEEFISHKSPAAGFDFASGKKIEQKLLDYNHEAERFGGAVAFFFRKYSPVADKHDIEKREMKDGFNIMCNDSHFCIFLNLGYKN